MSFFRGFLFVIALVTVPGSLFAQTIVRKTTVNVDYRQTNASGIPSTMDFSACPPKLQVDVEDLGSGYEHGQTLGDCKVSIDGADFNLNYNVMIKRMPERYNNGSVDLREGYFYHVVFDLRNIDGTPFSSNSSSASSVTLPLDAKRTMYFPFNMYMCPDKAPKCYGMWLSMDVDDN